MSQRPNPPAYWFPFGMFSLTFVSISILLCTFFINPLNDPKVVEFTFYFWAMGIVVMIYILGTWAISGAVDRTPIVARTYNPLGMWAAFAMGLGVLAAMRVFAPAPTFSNIGFDFSSLMQTEVYMFIVASIEELFFRIALAMFIYMIIPTGNEIIKIFSSLIGSSFLFALWHWYAYSADVGMMLIAFIAGVLLYFGYFLGTKVGGSELSFIGIVAGHWLWNISSIGDTGALITVISFLLITTLVILFVSPLTARVLVNDIRRRLPF